MHGMGAWHGGIAPGAQVQLTAGPKVDGGYTYGLLPDSSYAILKGTPPKGTIDVYVYGYGMVPTVTKAGNAAAWDAINNVMHDRPPGGAVTYPPPTPSAAPPALEDDGMSTTSKALLIAGGIAALLAAAGGIYLATAGSSRRKNPRRRNR